MWKLKLEKRCLKSEKIKSSTFHFLTSLSTFYLPTSNFIERSVFAKISIFPEHHSLQPAHFPAILLFTYAQNIEDLRP